MLRHQQDDPIFNVIFLKQNKSIPYRQTDTICEPE